MSVILICCLVYTLSSCHSHPVQKILPEKQVNKVGFENTRLSVLSARPKVDDSCWDLPKKYLICCAVAIVILIITLSPWTSLGGNSLDSGQWVSTSLSTTDLSPVLEKQNSFLLPSAVYQEQTESDNEDMPYFIDAHSVFDGPGNETNYQQTFKLLERVGKDMGTDYLLIHRLNMTRIESICEASPEDHPLAGSHAYSCRQHAGDSLDVEIAIYDVKNQEFLTFSDRSKAQAGQVVGRYSHCLRFRAPFDRFTLNKENIYNRIALKIAGLMKAFVSQEKSRSLIITTDVLEVI